DLSDKGDNDNDGNNGNDGDDDKQEGDDTNDDDEETDSNKTESDRIKIPVLDQSTIEYYEEKEEKIDDEETMYDDKDDEVTRELYKDVNINLGNKDADMTDADQGGADQQNIGGPTQSSSVSSDFTSKLLNLDNPYPADNEITSLMDTTVQHATAIPKITSSFTITIPPPPPFFNPLSQQATLTPTPMASDTTTSLSALPDFAYVFKFNERVTNLEKDLSEIKEEAQAEKREYIELVDSMKNVTGSLEAAVLTRSSSQPQSSYEAAATLSEFELTKILIDKMEKNKSYDKANYKKKLYDALVESYNTDKDLFNLYGEVFSLKRSRDERDKDRDPSVGSDRGTKRRKLSKDAESSRDLRSKEKKSLSTSKDASQSQHKSSSKSAHADEPSHTIEDSGMQQDQDQVARAEEPPTSFDEHNDTSFVLSAFVMNRLKIPNLTQEILVGPTFNLLKGTCKSIMELEFHFEECSKATTECLDWHNPENKPYLFDLRKPLPLIQDHRGRQIIPKDYFINNDLEYMKSGLSKLPLGSVACHTDSLTCLSTLTIPRETTQTTLLCPLYPRTSQRELLHCHRAP
ncbi:hypothetical protein Tco_0949693, partial [Tanacetum coccineum]